MKTIKELEDKFDKMIVVSGLFLVAIICLSGAMFADLYQKSSNNNDITFLIEEFSTLSDKVDEGIRVVGDLQEEGWAMALTCIDWDSDYCNELIVYNMSGSLVYQPRGTFEEDCNSYCIEESIRRVKFSFS